MIGGSSSPPPGKTLGGGGQPFNCRISLSGNIHTQIAMKNINWTFVGGWILSSDLFLW